MRVAITLSLLGLLVSACEENKPVRQESQNPQELADTESTESEQEDELPEHNFFKESPPESFCGKEGYAFLLEEYFAPQCGDTCHSERGFVTVQLGLPAFGDEDIDIAYAGALATTDSEFFETILENAFCQDFCELDEESEVFKAIEAWTKCR